MNEPAPLSDAPEDSSSESSEHQRSSLPLLALGALGVVYGDIGTSPLYAVRECFGPHGTTPTPENILGVLSLIVWSLVLVVAVKYLVFVVRADNRGEGGTLSIMALATRSRDIFGRRGLIVIGIVASALLYGEGMITPAISVLSAVEGLSLATDAFDPYVVPITIAILALVFVVQRSGTARVGAVFGPVMLVWFVLLALLGIGSIIATPEVLAAANPMHAIDYFRREGLYGIGVLGGVVLVITGGEALYADMGHFGIRPIRLTWFALAMPALLLNYFGQGALVLRDVDAVSNVFFLLAPEWALYPLVAIATMATVIASQALISASFSLTRSAIQLGYSPRMQVVHTSRREIGQVYVPAVNWALMLSCFALVIGFGSSSRLASAYGLAVTGVMTITSILFFAVARTHWRWPLWKAGGLTACFLVIDFAFFGANLMKFMEGAWFPLLVAALIFIAMTTWKQGRTILSRRLRESALPIDVFLADIQARSPVRVPGNAVFMSSSAEGVPHALLHNLKHNKVLHHRNVLLTLMSEEVPHVSDGERLEIQDLGHGFIRMNARYGFMQTPNVPRLFELAARQGYEYKVNFTTFFLGRETLIASRRRGMAIWREKFFAWMSINARSATAYFGLPPNRVVELGAQIEL